MFAAYARPVADIEGTGSSAGAYCHSYLKGRGNIHKDCLNERPYQTIHFDEILIKVRHIVRVIRI